MTSLNWDQESLQTELRRKKICRFCLSQDLTKITNIYMRDTRIKSSAPLPMQIMAIASIEVYSNDGMPSFICSDCTNIFEFSYQFKQMCKKADNLLRQFPLTGKWHECLEKPILQTCQSHLAVGPSKYTKTTQVGVQNSTKSPVQQESLLHPKKILNSSLSSKMVPPVAAFVSDNSIKSEPKPKLDFPETNEEFSITFLDKIENNEELSLDDIHQLIAAEDKNEAAFADENNMPVVIIDTGSKSTKPKLLNKSSIRILNKDAQKGNEPRLSLPKVKDVDGKTEIVAEILNINDKYEDEPDPTNAVVIETNVFPCTFCERTFPLLQLRDIHMKNHSRARKFQCEECEKSFFSKYDLHRHSFIHNGEKPFKCSICEKAFSRSSLLTRHEKTHTDVPKHICISCERSFLSKADLVKHTERHNITRPFLCKVCNKGFAFKQGLERHEVIHSTEQPFSCQYCEQSFSTTTKLSRHLTAHAGLRPYPCKFCRKSYLLSHHLTRHLRSHKNIFDSKTSVSFSCMGCNTSFESRDQLIRHSTSHANETNLSCPLCKDEFLNMNELTSHIQEHSEGEAYACEFCDLIFITADKLQSHTDIEHSQEMEAYHEDDRAKADQKKLEEAQKQENDLDEKIQNSVNEFLGEEFSNEGSESENLVKKNIKKEIEKQSPKIIDQIIIKNPTDNRNVTNDADNKNIILIPLKQRRINAAGESVATNTSSQIKNYHQLRRKTPNADATPEKTEAKQSNIQSLLKLPKSVTITRTSKTPTPKTSPSRETSPKPAPSKATLSNAPTLNAPPSNAPPSKETPPKAPPSKTTPPKAPPSHTPPSKAPPSKALPSKVSSSKPPPSKTPPSKAPPLKTPPSKTYSSKISPSKETVLASSGKIKVESPSPPVEPSSTSAAESVLNIKPEAKKIKVQKITVTKAQAAAMAKQGRIKIKDGKIILKK